MPDTRWMEVGAVLGAPYRRMVRRRLQGEPVDDLPIRIDWPLRVASGTAPPGPSRQVKEQLRWLEV